MTSLFSSLFQLAGAKSFSEFLKDDEERRPKRRSLKKTVAQRRKTRAHLVFFLPLSLPLS